MERGDKKKEKGKEREKKNEEFGAP